MEKEISPNLKKLASALPETPGVYKMKDEAGTVLYVGKAKDLRKRVATYFQKDYAHSSRTRKLLEHAEDLESIQTDSELEALILENALTKELRPKYNILMKDDKSYVYIEMNMNEAFPRISLVREHTLIKQGRKPGARYFGPKLASTQVYETMRMLKKLFPFRHCKLEIAWKGEAFQDGDNLKPNLQLVPQKNLVEVTNRVIDFPCLDYFIKRCPGPCIGATTPDEYKKIVQQIIHFLEGKNDDLEKNLKEQMMKAASQKLFEKAAKIRDKLFALEHMKERQKITDPDRLDTDVVHYVTDLGRLYFNVFMIRNGKLLHQENFVLDAFAMNADAAESAEILEAFLMQYYEKAADIPKEILLPEPLPEGETLEAWLSGKRGNRVILLTPQRGEKNKLLELSHKNAETFAKQHRIKWMAQERGETALARLAEVLGMKQPPKRIEGFDVSHLGGQQTVGSMVVFEKGAPLSAHYRHFKIRTVTAKPDDYRCMEEVLMRRLKYLGKKDTSISLKTPSKKDFEEVEKIANQRETFIANDLLQQKDFIAAKRKEKIIGFGRILKLSEAVSVLSSLWVDPAERGHRLGYQIIDKLIARSTLRRVYLTAHKNLEEYYAEFGFMVLREAPEILRKRLEGRLQERARQNEVINMEEMVFMVFEAKKKKADPSFASRPDLLVIDGGKGQLATATLVLNRLKLDIPVISLAKRLEEIYIPGEKAPLLLEEGDEALKLLQRVRDESHRFAITFQREWHRKEILK